ncbi:extracellular tyrosine-protein kinase PKDCC isoform X2 [Procambarus clarkii]|uniref:extracellular tyrosine-protein kinase PKDCC isoform X2 n=1 Tax=Procambarus clarkii TaxID=6728 RepID=UPI003742DDEE
MARVSRLGVYVTAYLCLCLLANVALVVIFIAGKHWTSFTPAALSADEWDPSRGWTFKCADLPFITNLSIIGSGWTKAVYRGQYGKTWLAVKTVHTSGHDMTECLESVSVCYQHCAAKIIKETRLLQELSHANVIKISSCNYNKVLYNPYQVYGGCIPDVEYSPGPPVAGIVAMVAELGRPVNVIEILQMNYEERLKLASDVGRILHHLAQSPLGSLLMNDFRREQFVISDGSLKLSDIDDIVVGDPKCTSYKDCAIKDGIKESILVNLSCVTGLCKGFNSRLNAVHASQHFMRLLIPYGGPAALESTCLRIVNQQSIGLLDSEAVHQEIQALVNNYSSGAYLSAAEKETIHSYTVLHGSTVHDADFSCSRTLSKGCVQSVSSPAEGAWLCSQFPECVAYVLIDEWTWTGRQVAVFKTRAREVKGNERHTLYIRRGQG